MPRTSTSPPTQRSVRSSEEIYKQQSLYDDHLPGYNSGLPELYSVQQTDLGRFHSLPLDHHLISSRCFPQMEYSSDTTISGHSFYQSGPNGEVSYNAIPPQENLSTAESSYDLQQQPTSLQETLEPHMMFRHHIPLMYDESPSYSPYDQSSTLYGSEQSSFDTLLSPYGPATPQDQYMGADAHFSPTTSDVTLSTPTSKHTEEEDDDDCSLDKPYARLIYEALMQAPGHRMTLRDIYVWFEQNTNKSRESGSNGWQNSIRHNLSMNQAFENDKSEASARGHPRKANSVWILTDHAIKHGVQSTTRYRRSGTSKKSSGYRTPATERQKSGSKGGKAARRAAQLRRQEQMLCDSSALARSLEARWLDHSASPTDQIPTPRYCPATPVDTCQYTSMYGLPQLPYSSEQPMHLTQKQGILDDDQGLRYLSDPTFDRLSKPQYDTNPLRTMFT